MKKWIMVVAMFLLASIVGVGVILAEEFMLIFESLSVGYEFTATQQAYEHLGVIIGGDGKPRVIDSFLVPAPAGHALRNDPGGEFGSEYEDLDFDLDFAADWARVHVGKDTFETQVTAVLEGWNEQTLVDSDTVALPDLRVGPVVELMVEAGEGEQITFLRLSYGSASSSEIVDNITIHVREGGPLPPPEDTTPPEVHITHPTDGSTVSTEAVTGYVDEDVELEGTVTVVTPVETRDFTVSPPVRVDGVYRYHFGGWINFQEGANEIQVTARDLAGHEHTATVNVTYEPPDDPPPPTEWPETLDIRAGSDACLAERQCGMEVTQVIQGWEQIGTTPYPNDNETQLIADKRTLVRVYGMVSGVTIDVPGVTCQLRAFDSVGGTELAGSPLWPMETVTLVPGETYLQQRPDSTKSFNFLLPPEWTEAGTIYLEATVNPGNRIPEGTGNYDVYNTVSHDVTFHSTRPLYLYVYRYRLSSESDVAPTRRECEENIALTRQLYPVEPEEFLPTGFTRLETAQPLGTDDDLSGLLASFRHYLGFIYGSAYALPYHNTVYLGLTHSADTHRGVTDGVFPVSLSVASNRAIQGDDYTYYRMKTAHEIGHALDMDHVEGDDAHGCGSPDEPYEPYPNYRNPIDNSFYFPASIGDYGVDIDATGEFTVINPADTADMMSYCDNRWMSVYSWEKLANDRFVVSSLSATAARSISAIAPSNILTPYLTINGMVSLNMTATSTLDPIWTQMLPSGSSDHVGTGDYTLKLLDGSAAVLFERHFDLDPASDLERYAFFQEVVPAKTGTRVVELSGGSMPSPVSITAHLSAPTVEIVAPTTSAAWDPTGSQEIYWEASDADGDPLTFVVFYSADNGDTWQVIGADLVQPGLPVLLDDLPGCQDSCLVRVAASDGINQGEDTSDPFSKGTQAPWASILEPQPTNVFACKELVIFEGLAGDPEDGSIARENLVWTSDRDGVVGTGLIMGTTHLSAGLHQITLTATDSEEMQASDTTAVYVLPCHNVYLPLILR